MKPFYFNFFLAATFYKNLATRAANNGHTVDIFECSLDQTGLYEMQEICKKTGGFVVLADGFDVDMFKQSFQKIFTKDEKNNYMMGLNGTMEVITSREIKIAGAIGPCASLQKKV